jgi:hypothetical protein
LEEEKDDEKKNTGLPKLPDFKISIDNYDNLKLRIGEIIRQSTNPQIANLEFSDLLTVGESSVYLIGISKTRNLPAMVTYGNHNRFFKRKSGGKYSLDTYELYETFSQLNVLEDKIKSFIKDRQFKVSENSFWPDIGSLSSILIHTIPISTFSTQIENFSSSDVKKILIDILSPPGHNDYSYRYCWEGFHLYQNKSLMSDNDIMPYNLIFRNGSTETFTNEPFYSDPNKGLLVNGEGLLTVIKEQLEKNLTLCKKLSIEPYFYISIKLNNIENMLLTPTYTMRRLKNHTDLQLPLTLMPSDIQEIKKQIKNLMDILWQSIGDDECPSQGFDKVFNTFAI